MELLRATEHTFAQFGGHAAAGGFTLLDSEVFFLEDRLVETYERITANNETVDTLLARADAILVPEEATVSYLTKVERLSPFGVQNPKPVFLLRDIKVREISHFGKGNEHLKLKIDSHEGNKSLDAVTFFVKGAIARTADSLTQDSRVNLLAHLERDTFSRGNPVRLRLLDIKLV
ncbi:hypothetical protein A3A36_02845 [Candidatus Kaiserbacteria bacterium RIFCSPLOWO2_01_FULL_52_12b]|uniref:RecJ OB domain-containing protein n=1 Tax=Candidatus Kaiserbacteria bacterium RIFCSPLOWO2_01_FULL_52_12b TaxID=1798509 RepID=A0A1F6EWU6_9BACT|nr:MAG: hypothetical protein A3A36_02845 [Candidatus Kaiserbacteria bacterium RIFCSPLOWO2_01_FULL_52_12b]